MPVNETWTCAKCGATENVIGTEAGQLPTGWAFVQIQTQTDAWKYSLCPTDKATVHADIDTVFPNK